MNLSHSIPIRLFANARFVALGATLGLAISSAWAQESGGLASGTPVRSTHTEAEAFVELGSFGKSLQRFNWDEEYFDIRASIENIWRNNDWTDEADVFARDTAVGLSEIPPWKPLDRISFITDKFAERYDASDALKLRVSLLLVREASGLFIRHGKTIMSQATEYLEMREAGRAFTAEDVARWAREGQPALDDLHETSDRIFEMVREQLNPVQRAILDRDFQSYSRRRKGVEAMMKQWSAGQWTPQDWGFTEDMMRRATGTNDKGDVPTKNDPPAVAASAVPPMQSIAPPVVRIRCDEYEPRSWGACAAEIVEKYSLDAGQRTTADSIVAELSDRAFNYYRPRAELLAKVSDAQRETEPDFEPIRRDYAEMLDRLEAIPTTAQRIRAAEMATRP